MALLQILREIGRIGVNEFCDSGDCQPISEEEQERVFNMANDPISQAFVADLKIKIEKGFHHRTSVNTVFPIGNGAEIDVSKLITEYAQHFGQCAFYEAIVRGVSDHIALFNAVIADMENGLYPISGQEFLKYTGRSDIFSFPLHSMLHIKPNVYCGDKVFFSLLASEFSSE